MRLWLVGALVLGACSDPPRPPPPRMDAGPRDAGTGMDSAVDGAIDAGDASTPDDARVGFDAGTDAGLQDAGPLFDAGRRDVGVGVDAGPFDAGDFPDAALDDPCMFVPPAPSCTVGSCASGERCIDNGCGDTRCVPGGHPCGATSDCPSGSSCAGNVCVRAGGGCGDSRDCPLGFACEASACVDRRIGCDIGIDCPHGFFCDFGLEFSAPYCFRANSPCVADTGCPFELTCADVAGNGVSLCRVSTGPNCRTNADCAPRGVCGNHPEMRESECMPFGPCATAADCSAGHECRDLWGDGILECVPSGSCRTQTDCPARSVCAVPFMGSATECINTPI